jgi:hypothetical protein
MVGESSSLALVLDPPPSSNIVHTNSFSVLESDPLKDKWDEAIQAKAGSKEVVPVSFPSIIPVPVKSQVVEPRLSQRFQQKNIGGKGAGRGKSKTPPTKGTTLTSDLDSIVSHFPFAEFLDSDVVKLFKASGFLLGKKK